jgi:hypothetical protein
MFGIDLAMSSSEKGMLQREMKQEVKKGATVVQMRQKQWMHIFLSLAWYRPGIIIQQD